MFTQTKDLLALPVRVRDHGMKLCLHMVSYFEECSSRVTRNSPFMFWELHGTLPILTVTDLNLLGVESLDDE